MPFESRLFIKASLVCFVLALLTGVMWGAGTLGFGPRLFAVIFPTYVHLFVVGWVTQMIIGVALWLFPKLSKERPRGSSALSYVAFATINLGLALRVIAEPYVATGADIAIWGGVLAVSAVLQWIGGMSFVMNIWRRVKGR